MFNKIKKWLMILKFSFCFGFALQQSKKENNVGFVEIKTNTGNILIEAFVNDRLCNLLSGNKELPSCFLLKYKLLGDRTKKINYRIFINSVMANSFSSEELLAIYLHEAGHLVLGHLDAEGFYFINDIELEFEADHYAIICGYGDKLASALDKTLSIVKKENAIRADKNNDQIIDMLNKRIARINNIIIEGILHG